MGVETELLRIALAKSQLNSADGMLWSMVLPELQNTISSNNTVEKFLRPQSALVLNNNTTTSSGATQKGRTDAAVSAVWLVGGSMRRVQIPGSTLMRPNRLQQLKDNEAIIANVAKSTLPLQSDTCLLHCANLRAKLPDQTQTCAKQQATTRAAPPVAPIECTPAPSTKLDVL